MQGNGSKNPPSMDPESIRLRELGEFLRRTRESQHRTVEDVVEATKVRGRYLQAIENGDVSMVPGLVYVRGFIRSYADYLGLDGMEIVHQYLGRPRDEEAVAEPSSDASAAARRSPYGSSGGARPSRTARETGNTRRADSRQARAWRAVSTRVPRTRRSSQILGVIAAVVLVVTVAAVAHSVMGGAARAPGTAKGQSSANSLGGSAQPGSSQSPQKGQSSHKSGRTPTTRNAVTLISAGVASYRSNFTVKTAGLLTLTVTGLTGQCWVEVWRDGQVATQSAFVKQGQTLTWSSSHTLKILVGASNRIRMTINGVAVPLVHATGGYTYAFTRQ